jgi:hypothetical protein
LQNTDDPEFFTAASELWVAINNLHNVKDGTRRVSVVNLPLDQKCWEDILNHRITSIRSKIHQISKMAFASLQQHILQRRKMCETFWTAITNPCIKLIQKLLGRSIDVDWSEQFLFEPLLGSFGKPDLMMRRSSQSASSPSASASTSSTSSSSSSSSLSSPSPPSSPSSQTEDAFTQDLNELQQALNKVTDRSYSQSPHGQPSNAHSPSTSASVSAEMVPLSEEEYRQLDTALREPTSSFLCAENKQLSTITQSLRQRVGQVCHVVDVSEVHQNLQLLA